VSLSIAGLAPPFLVKIFARPYVAGDSLESALTVATELLEKRSLLTTLDLLAEDIETEHEATQNALAYERMIDGLASRPRLDAPLGRPTFSLKPSSFTTSPLDRGPGNDARGSREHIEALVALARHHRFALTIDMEDRSWTDWTLALARDLAARGNDHVGIVLQTRLHRTERDLDALPARIRVRLVIGIYQEPRDVATTDKRVMKERMLEFAGKLLTRGHFVEFATHDEEYVRRFVTEVVPGTGAGADRFEVQMLYGVPRESLLADLRAGRIGGCGPVTGRLYVPYALSWKQAIAYLRRRLRENPTMATYVLGNLVARALGRDGARS
jgi:proline dehydrogenase